MDISASNFSDLSFSTGLEELLPMSTCNQLAGYDIKMYVWPICSFVPGDPRTPLTAFVACYSALFIAWIILRKSWHVGFLD